MAAPTFVSAGVGATDATGAWTTGAVFSSATAGNMMIFQMVQDGTGANTLGTPPSVGDNDTRLTVTNISGLDGTGSRITYIGTFAVGGALQHLWIGRKTAAGTMTIAGSNSVGDDLYWRFYEFTNVSAGTTLATVIENIGGTSDLYANGSGTSTTISDTGVTTSGVDRLAVQFVGANDDIAVDAFVGETGGDWGEAVAEYADSGGTDAMLQLQTAAMASAGTINGGSDTVVSAGWGVVGFALIGTTAGGNTYTKAGYGKENG